MFARKGKRSLALLLTVVMLLSLLPFSALAVPAAAYTSDDQIVDAGETTYPDTPDNRVVLNKTVSTTDTEGKFKITLGVTTKDKISTDSNSVGTTADVVLVIDASGSMSGNDSRLAKAQIAAKSFVSSFLGSSPDGKRQIAVVPFSEYVNSTGLIGLTYNATALTNAIDSITASGGTNIMAGLSKAKEILDASTAAHKYVVLLTDGEPTYYYNGVDSSRVSMNKNSFIPVNHDYYDYWWYGHHYTGYSTYQQDYVYTQFGTDRQGSGGSTGENYIYNTVSQARLLKDAGIEIFGIGINIGDSPEGQYTMYNSVTLTGTPGDLSYAGHYFDYSSSSGSDLATQLSHYFEVISRNITVKTNSWLISDTMGGMVNFAGFVTGSQNTATQSGGVISWDLKTSGTTCTGSDADGWTYETQYYVKLKTSDIASGTAYPTNASATLTYSFDDDVYSVATGGHIAGEMILHTADFAVPRVRGFLGGLTFTKAALEEVDHEHKALQDAEFSLTGTTTVGNTLATLYRTSDIDGHVAFSNLPAGTYILSETKAPGGYDLVAPMTVTVAFGAVSIGSTAVDGSYSYTVYDPLHQTYQPVKIAKNWLAPEDFQEPVEITLWVDGVTFGTPITLDGTETPTPWQAEFEHVPTVNLNTGEAAKYTFTETGAGGAALKHSFDTSTAPNDQHVYVITNRNISDETRDIQVTKDWDPDGASTGAVAIYLIVNGTADSSKTITLDGTESPAWTNSFTDLPMYDSVSGQEIAYSVGEDTLTGFSPAVVTGNMDDGFTVRNTVAQSDVTIPVTKAWTDYNNHYNTRSSVTIALYADYADGNTTPVNTMTLDGATDAIETTAWYGTFSTDSEGQPLPKYKFNSDGTYADTITYTVAETSSLENYTAEVTGTATAGFTVTNTLDDVKDLTIHVEKEWILENEGSEVSVKIQLFKDGTETELQNIELDGTEDPAWTGSFQAVESHDKTTGALISYTVSEVTPTGFTLRDRTGAGTAANPYVFTNIENLTDTTSVTVNKRWVDSGADKSASGYRPEVTFTLFANGEDTGKTITLDGTESPAWTGSFTGLPENQYKNSLGSNDPYTTEPGAQVIEVVPIEYTVEEGDVPGYTKAETDPAVDGSTFTFTNTIAQQYIDIPVEKVWVDTGSETHPAVTIYLWKDEVGADPKDALASITIPQDATGDALKVKFENLPKYDLSNDAALIKYVVSEGDVPGYNGEVKYDEINAKYVVTNTVSQQYVTIEGTKTWIGPDEDQVQVTINLYQDKNEVAGENLEPVASVTLYPDDYENGQASYTFMSDREDGKWPVYKDGMTEKHVYTVEETGCPDTYTSSIVNGYSVTNSVKQVYTEVHFTKTWVDPYDTELVATDATGLTATFILKQDGTQVNRVTLGHDETGYTFTTYADGVTLLPTYKQDGSLYTYTVEEDTSTGNYPAGYTPSVDSQNPLHFINTIAQATVDIPVTKVWAGVDGKPMNPVTFQLQKYDSGEERFVDVDGATITLDGTETPTQWHASFTGLDKYDLSNGQTIGYSVRELSFEGGADYTSTNAFDEETGGYIFTNTYKTYYYQVNAYFDIVFNGTVSAPVKIAGSLIPAVKGETYSANPEDYIGLAPSDSYGGSYTYQTGASTSVTITTPYSEDGYVHTINLYFIKNVNTPVTISVTHEYYVNGSLEYTSETETESVTYGSAVTASAYSQPTYGSQSYTLDADNANVQNIASVLGGETITLRYDRTTGGGGGDDTPIYYTVHYTFSGSHPDVTLPADESYARNTTVQVADGYDDVTTSDGVWHFEGWSRTGEFNITGRTTITGTWTYTANEIVIVEEEPPLGETPVTEEPPVEIEEPVVPSGNLPQTGTAAAPVNPMWTLGMLALSLSMAAAGLTITFSRKKDEDQK